MSERPDPSTRLIELEERYTELERLVDQLNEVLVEHTRELETLRREGTELRVSLQALEQKQDPSTEPPPPHY